MTIIQVEPYRLTPTSPQGHRVVVYDAGPPEVIAVDYEGYDLDEVANRWGTLLGAEVQRVGEVA